MPLPKTAIIFSFIFTSCAQAQEVIFSPSPRNSITLITQNSTIKIKNETNLKNSRTIDFDTERQLHIDVEDYNFDGLPDFAIWYLDDGMGSYSIHRVFIYSSKSNDFHETFPRCGDEFINLKKLKKNNH